MICKILILITILHSFVSSTPIHSPIEYIGKFPYHVSVRDINGKHICGGAIIKTNIILASGQCMSGGLADHIVAGSVNPTDIDGNFTQTIKIGQTERNIGFFGERYMLLYFLDNALKYGYGVQPIKISENNPIEGNQSRITGFVELNGEKKLRSTDLKISSYNQCKELLNHPSYNDIVFCTAIHSKKDMCRAYEETSLLVCRGSEIELCGLPFSNKNFMCNDIIEGDHSEIEKKEYIAGFVKISAFRNWLSDFGAL